MHSQVVMKFDFWGLEFESQEIDFSVLFSSHILTPLQVTTRNKVVFCCCDCSFNIFFFFLPPENIENLWFSFAWNGSSNSVVSIMYSIRHYHIGNGSWKIDIWTYFLKFLPIMNQSLEKTRNFFLGHFWRP